MSGFFDERTREWHQEAVHRPHPEGTTARLELAWEERSGPADLVAFLGAWPVARTYRDARSEYWLWSATWLSGVGMMGSAHGREEAVAAAEEAVGGFVSQSGLTEKEITNL